MQKEHVVYFTNLYPLPWEPARAAYNKQIVSALRMHCDVDVLTPVPAPVWFRQLLKGKLKNSEATLFPFFFLPGFGRRTYALTLFMSMLLCVYPLVRLIKAKHIVASWAYPEGVVASLFKKWGNRKVAIHCVGTDINYHFRHSARQKQMLRAFDRADEVITVSRDLAGKIVPLATASTRCNVVYNGVSFDKFTLSDATTHSKSFLYIGNLLTTKGVYELASAAALLKARGLDFTLDIVGKGPESDKLKAQISSDNLDDIVTFHGAVLHDDIPALLAKARALVLPSYREGVPNVIMESLAAGVPPVATAVGGIPEIVRDGENGILVQELNASTLADAMQKALEKDWDNAALRHSVSEYTWENCAQGFLSALSIR